MKAASDDQIRKQLVKHIKGGEAFMPIDEVLKKVSFKDIGIVPSGVPYSFYQVMYHIRLAQFDIMEFSRNPEYQSPEWPKEYWPQETAPSNQEEWEKLKIDYFNERQELCDLLLSSENDLLKPFEHGTGQNLLREVLLVIEHNAYHTGQLLVLLRLLGKY